jgi:hypothetical protein
LFTLTVGTLAGETCAHLNYNRHSPQLSAERETIVSLRKYQNTRQLGKGAFVDRSAVVIGDVEIGEDSSVWPLTVIRGDMHRIRIGARTSVQDGCVAHHPRRAVQPGRLPAADRR